MPQKVPNCSGEVPRSDTRDPDATVLPAISTPVIHNLDRPKAQTVDTNEEGSVSRTEQDDAVSAISGSGAHGDDSLHRSARRVRRRGASFNGSMSTSGVNSDVTSEHVDGAVEVMRQAAASVPIPTVGSLLKRAQQMLLCDSGGPAASTGDDTPVQVTKGLVLNASEAISELFESQRAAVQQACGKLDEREALAYLLGDVSGLGIISAEAARKAGDKAGKLVWVKKGTSPIKADLADARRAVQRRASKLPEGLLEKALDDSRTAVLRAPVKLPLVLSQAVKRKRTQPSAHEKRVDEFLHTAAAPMPGWELKPIELTMACKCPEIKAQIQELTQCRGLSDATKKAAITGIVRVYIKGW